MGWGPPACAFSAVSTWSLGSISSGGSLRLPLFWLEMHGGAGTARKQEGGQEARRLVGTLPLIWLVLAGFCCFGIFLMENFYFSWGAVPPLDKEHPLCQAGCVPSHVVWIGVQPRAGAADQAPCFGGAGQCLWHSWYLHWDPGSLPQETSVVKKTTMRSRSILSQPWVTLLHLNLKMVELSGKIKFKNKLKHASM